MALGYESGSTERKLTAGPGKLNLHFRQRQKCFVKGISAVTRKTD